MPHVKSIQEANANLATIICATPAERDIIVKKLHEENIVHVTTGSKDYADYLQRSRRGVIPDHHLALSLYGGEFFAIVETASSNYPQIPATQIV